jgi:hypothetical protein
MKKSQLINLVKEELKGYSKYIGTTQGLTDKELERILMMIAKEEDTEETNEITNPVDRLTLDVPLFIRLLEYAKEDAKTDMDLHDLTEKAIKLGSVPGTALSMKDYDALVSDQEELAEEKPGLWANIRAKRARGEKPSHGNSKAFKDAVKAGKKINKMSEGEEWPKEVPSRHGDIIFKLIKVMPDRAKYALIDAETGKEWEPGGRVFGSIKSLIASAEDTIMPQGGRRSTNLG